MGFVDPRGSSTVLRGFTFKQPLTELLTGVKTVRHVLLSSDISDLLLLEVRNSPQSPEAPWVGLLIHLSRSAALQLGCFKETKVCLAASSRMSLASGTEPGCLWCVAPQQGYCCSGCPRLCLWLLQGTHNSTCFHTVPSSSRDLQRGIKVCRCQQTGQTTLWAGLPPGTDLNSIITITIPVGP